MIQNVSTTGGIYFFLKLRAAMYRKISPFFNDSIFVSLPEFWHLNFVRGRNLSAHCERSVGRIPKIPGLCYFLKPIKFAHYVSVNNILLYLSVWKLVEFEYLSQRFCLMECHDLVVQLQSISKDYMVVIRFKMS